MRIIIFHLPSLQFNFKNCFVGCYNWIIYLKLMQSCKKSHIVTSKVETGKTINNRASKHPVSFSLREPQPIFSIVIQKLGISFTNIDYFWKYFRYTNVSCILIYLLFLWNQKIKNRFQKISSFIQRKILGLNKLQKQSTFFGHCLLLNVIF